MPAGGSTPSVVPAEGGITQLPLPWFSFIWGGGCGPENLCFPPSHLGLAIRPFPSPDSTYLG